MTSKVKKVARGLGLSGGFTANNSAESVNAAEVVEQPTTQPRTATTHKPTSTASVIRNIDNPTKTASVTSADLLTDSPPIPSAIVAGIQPKKRSGEGRVGISRRYSDDVVKTTIVMPTAVHDKLSEIIFHNRKTSKESLNDLMLQGIDLLLADFGVESIDQLVKQRTGN